MISCSSLSMWTCVLNAVQYIQENPCTYQRSTYVNTHTVHACKYICLQKAEERLVSRSIVQYKKYIQLQIKSINKRHHHFKLFLQLIPRSEIKQTDTNKHFNPSPAPVDFVCLPVFYVWLRRLGFVGGCVQYVSLTLMTLTPLIRRMTVCSFNALFDLITLIALDRRVHARDNSHNPASKRSKARAGACAAIHASSNLFLARLFYSRLRSFTLCLLLVAMLRQL